MTMLEKQKELANIYKYKPLPPLLSFMQRQEYEDNLPDEFRNYKQNTPIYSKISKQTQEFGETSTARIQ